MRIFKPKKSGLLFVLACMFLSFSEQKVNSSYIGLDEYSNQLISLQLNADNSYVYTENFLDGSELIDKGEWKLHNNILTLESTKKTKRVHQSQEFKKTYKFKGEKFLVKEDRLEYMWTNKRSENQYLMKYTVRKIN